MPESQPARPRAAALGGRFVELIGWVIVLLAAGLVVLQIVERSVSIAGLVLALFVAVAGGATVGTGRTIERSRRR
jgi:hypothetical protein